MKKAFLVTLLSLGTFHAWAQAGERDMDDVVARLYRDANNPDRLRDLANEAASSPQAYLVPVWQPGTLLTISRNTRPAPGLRYNVARQLLELKDSVGGLRVFPVGSLRGFTIGESSNARTFRTRLTRGTGSSSGRAFVEIFTEQPDGPLVLALAHRFVDKPAEMHPILRVETQKARREIGQLLLAGPGQDAQGALRPLELNERSVLKLFGPASAQLREYAAKNSLRYEELADVMKLVNEYNRRQAAAPAK
ncbi:hypothetical protein LJY25_20705 [Hymenobacter sp. BT175]|uniref:hypothetical protein n=1 Tax=Hymenobacter translucens TaxID=2886507 RepID=UPI001D0F22D1|nr:hypothetical protein [Hymenobacter translucens]MCC2548882.1 hypothetical protein [Hymenobacter translucens]